MGKAEGIREAYRNRLREIFSAGSPTPFDTDHEAATEWPASIAPTPANATPSIGDAGRISICVLKDDEERRSESVRA